MRSGCSACQGRPRPLVDHADAGGRAGGQPPAQLAAAGRRHGAVLGADRAHAGHRLGGVARLVVRPRGLDHGGGRGVGAGVPGRDAGGAGVRGQAAMAAGAFVRQRHRVAGPDAARLRHAGAGAVLRDRGADDAHDARRGHRPAGGAVHRDGAAEGRLADAHGARACAAQCGGADRQRGGAEPVVPAGRRDHRGDDLQLPGHRQADGRRRLAARHAAGADLRHDLLLRLPDPGDAADICGILANPRLRHR
jgi:hypothetical protein